MLIDSDLNETYRKISEDIMVQHFHLYRFPLKFSKELKSVFYRINVFWGEGMPKPSTRLSLSSNKMQEFNVFK